ncbi:unnamed protein product [Rhizoctonia solani]|uniref:NACHT domain-containing protein n=1 Tax=Rhizoctonia solani TaxID=456999 RepID=A0A8H3DVB0_9AGAM|nr:unnamed protein product [Rhizoctonia solani]
MESGSSKSNRKRANAPSTGDQLHPGEWRGSKRAKSISPSRPPTPAGASDGSNSLLSQNSNQRSPSTVPSTAWTGLERALRGLRLTTKACPPLRSAIDDMVSCVPLFEAAAKNRKDCEELAIGLQGMVQLLDPHLADATSDNISTTIKDIAEAMRKEILSIESHQPGRGLRRVLSATNDEEDLVRRYRRIEQLFRQLCGEATLNAWSISNKHYVNTQLESLLPAKLARYDSALSIEVSRRSCTENTRTEILGNLMKWSEDEHAANIYWMNGMAGTGKTTIAYSACTVLEARKQLAASFFCTRTSAQCRDAKRIVPTIAYQLARRSTPFRSALCKVLEEDTDVGTGMISAQFEQLLRAPLMEAQKNMPNNLVVVIDALDECSDPYIVELFLGILFRSVVDLPIKFFVTSRPEPIIRQRMLSESERSRSILYLHEIEASLVQADIELYLRDELASISPSDNDIRQLAKHAGKLFIYAATAVRYIRPPGRISNSRERLETILVANTESNKSLVPIDTLYSVILTTAIIEDEGLEPKERERIFLVLWTVVCACEPVLINTIAAISGIKKKDQVVAALEPLGSVLHISDHSELVATLHASFPDYILNQKRSGRFACDIPKHNYLLSIQCFQIMEAQLRFNICNIKSSFIPDSKIPDLEEQINANISEELFYACRFWMDHLSSVVAPNSLQTNTSLSPLLVLNEFLSQRLLFWMEVLNLKKCIRIAISSTSQLNAWLSRACPGSDIHELASNVQAFVVSYASCPISAYTSHIYLSALPLSPFLPAYLPRFKGLIKVSGTILNRIRQAALGTWESESPTLSTAFSPKSDRLLLGEENGKLSFWNIHDGKYIFPPFKAHSGGITSVAISRDGTHIVTSSDDTTLSVWSAHDGLLVSGPFRGHKKGIRSVSFSPDVSRIVSGSDDCTIGIWISYNDAAPMRQLTGHTRAVISVSFSPDGTRVLSGSCDYTVYLWDISSGTAIRTFLPQDRPGSVSLVQFTPDGTDMIALSLYNQDRDRLYHQLYVWDASTGRPHKRDEYQGKNIAISPEGDRVAGSIGHCIYVWDRNHSGEQIAGPLKGHAGEIIHINFSNDGTYIISAADDQSIRVWNVNPRVHQTKQISKVFLGTDHMIATSEPHHMCIAAAGPTNISVFNLGQQTMRHIDISEHGPIIFLRFSLDHAIFSVHKTGVICSWNAHTAMLIGYPRKCSSSTMIGSAVCSADGARVATVYGFTVEVWDAQGNRSSARCPHYRHVEMVFCQAAKMLLIQIECGNRNSLDLWDVDQSGHTTRLISDLSLRREASDLSPDGTYVAYCPVSVDGSLLLGRLINTATKQINPMPFQVRLSRSCGKTSTGVIAKFTLDSLHVAFAVGSKCYIWDIQNKSVIAALNGLNTIPTSISYDLNGFCLVSGLASLQAGLSSFEARQFNIHEPMALRPDGWMVDNQSRLLFWVPAEIRKEFPRSSGVTVGDGHWLFVESSNIFVGEEWSQCYIGG